MSEVYSDKTFALIDKITEALESGEITREEALALLGLALRKEANDLVNQEMRQLRINNNKRYKRALFLNYTNEIMSYG